MLRHAARLGTPQPPFSSETPSDRPSPGHQTVPDTLVEDTAPENQEKNQPLPKQSPPESQASQSQPPESQNPPESQASQSQPPQSQEPPESQATQSQPPQSQKPPESQATQSQPPHSQKPPESQASQSQPRQSQKPPESQASQPQLKALPKKGLQPTSKFKPGPQQDDEYDPGEEAIAPPEQVSKGTLMKRLARLCTPREDGSLKLPADVIETYKNLRTRDEVYRSFEKCGCDPVCPARLGYVLEIQFFAGLQLARCCSPRESTGSMKRSTKNPWRQSSSSLQSRKWKRKAGASVLDDNN